MIEVLCVGHAAWDVTARVPAFPAEDDKAGEHRGHPCFDVADGHPEQDAEEQDVARRRHRHHARACGRAELEGG